MMRPPIILLKEGTENKQGKQQIVSNIQACQVRIFRISFSLLGYTILKG